MTTPSDPPPYSSPSYIPAPHLVANSPLTAEQLVAHFQDFKSSLRHVSVAPELVFERLVANLNDSFNAALKLERALHAKEVAELNQALLRAGDHGSGRGKATESSQGSFGSPSHSEKQPEKQPTTETRPQNTPTIGAFSTDDIRSRNQLWEKNSKTITFTTLYSKPPSLVFGLTMVDIGRKKQIRVTCYPANTQSDSFTVNIDTWSGTNLYGASCVWLEIAADDPDFQCGSYHTLDYRPWNQPEMLNTRRITFAHPYPVPPTVVTWLTGFDMNREKNWRIRTFATDVSRTEFTLHIDTWGDSVLYTATASWVAYTAGKEGVASGSFNTLSLRSWRNPQSNNSAYERFNGAAFKEPPRVLLAINMLDIDRRDTMRLAVKASSVSAAGMTWHLDSWGNTTLHSAGASYIAFGSTPSKPTKSPGLAPQPTSGF